ncbi:MAG: leucyl aminopeptidase [Candidatus Sericytochromatia bacterium]|nr:leucyl aminopeptidase [Candidatus Sericytochromatia bacterium]
MQSCFSSLTELTAQALVVFCDERLQPDERLIKWDEGHGGLIERVFAAGDFAGRPNECLLVVTPQHPTQRVVLVGLGKPGKTSLESLRQAAGTASRQIQGARISSMALLLPAAEMLLWSQPAPPSVEELAQAVFEGVALSSFRFTRASKTDNDTATASRHVEMICRETEVSSALKSQERALLISQAVDHARTLVIKPGNEVTPEILAQEALSLGLEAGLHVEIHDEKWLAERGFEGILAVARGSAQMPRLIVLHHRGGAPDQKPIAVVGKGVTFDSGGIGIKPSQGMHKMKYDMAGGAATLAILLAAARLRLPLNVVGVIPAVENMPSGSALCPNEIVKMHGGLTVEINDTDAEGRIILADALSYASKDLDAAALVDMATLTGSVGIALGRDICGVMGTHKGMIEEMLLAGTAVGEAGWELPLDERFDVMVKSDVADLLNYPGRYASCITAASFMKPFTGEKPWVHLDIAGVAWADKDAGYKVKGPTGAPVRMVLRWLENRSQAQ